MNNEDSIEQSAPDSHPATRVLKGRGAAIEPPPRYLDCAREAFDDGWGTEDEAPPKLDTVVSAERARSLISRNESPDVPFSQSVNPYRGCEHGCVYCYARTTHAWLDLSPGLDFESRLFAKTNAAEVLRRELAAPGYRCAPLAIGVSTDAYQPVERALGITRELLALMVETRHPCTLITKGALIERDLDLLGELAALNLVEVYITLTTLDHTLARRLEPRATAPRRRLETVRRLSAAGIPVGVMFAPVIAGLNDQELETVIESGASCGAESASWVLLRLPQEINPMFQAWLAAHYPLKAGKVMSLMRAQRGGKEYDSDFSQRMRGTGPVAALLAGRFDRVCRSTGLNRTRRILDCALFRPPARNQAQLTLF
ncbi:MAG: hypothetical protein RL434_119 [Pseudomonadota bacterium]